MKILAVVCVRVFRVIDDPRLFDFNPFEKDVLSKESEKSSY